MHAERAIAGLIGYALLGVAAIFALAATVVVSWRNWLGWQKKPKADERPPNQRKR